MYQSWARGSSDALQPYPENCADLSRLHLWTGVPILDDITINK